MSRRGQRRRISLYVVHRWVGAAAALLVLIVASTGLVLNHAADWGLDRRPVRIDALLDAYGIDVRVPEQGFRVGDHWLIAIDGTTYFDTHPVGATGALLGVGHLPPLVLAVGSSSALLLDEHGALLERFDVTGWPGPIRSVAASDSGFVVSTPGGDYETGPELLTWRARPHGSAIVASAPRTERVPTALAKQVQDDARARALNWERVLLDIHSGRLPGRLGVIAADLLALALIALALSGLALWIRFLRQRAQRNAASWRSRR